MSASLHQRTGAATAGRPTERETFMIDVVIVPPLLALLIGILILVVPRILNYAVAAYLIIIGVLGLMQHFS